MSEKFGQKSFKWINYEHLSSTQHHITSESQKKLKIIPLGEYGQFTFKGGTHNTLWKIWQLQTIDDRGESRIFGEKKSRRFSEREERKREVGGLLLLYHI